MLNAALSDVVDGLQMWRLWGRLGAMEIRRRYRRTVLGPFWASLSLAILIAAMGVLFANLWKLDVADYLPYLASGFIVWFPISAIIMESCGAFVAAAGTIQQVRLPYSLFIYVVLWRNLIVFGHHVAVYVVIAVIFSVPVNANSLLVLVGLIFLCLNGVWVGLLVGALTTRFRDVQPLLASLLQILLFVTPIFWPPELLARRVALLVDLNPFYHFVAILRAPLLGQAPEAISWYAVVAVTVAGWSLTLFVFGRVRDRLPYWL